MATLASRLSSRLDRLDAAKLARIKPEPRLLGLPANLRSEIKASEGSDFGVEYEDDIETTPGMAVDDFGLASPEDISFLKTAGDYKITQLADAFHAFYPTWVKTDANAANVFMGDFASLQARWGMAKAKAASSSLASGVVAGLTGGFVGIQSVQDALTRATQQVPGTTTKGDFQDLVVRLAKAMGKPVADAVDLSHMPQPGRTASDVAYAAAGAITKPIDTSIDAAKKAWQDMMDAIEKQKRELGEGIDTLAKIRKWFEDHKTVIVIGAVAVGGLLVLSTVVGMFKAAPIVLKGATGGLV